MLKSDPVWPQRSNYKMIGCMIFSNCLCVWDWKEYYTGSVKYYWSVVSDSIIVINRWYFFCFSPESNSSDQDQHLFVLIMAGQVATCHLQTCFLHPQTKFHEFTIHHFNLPENPFIKKMCFRIRYTCLCILLFHLLNYVTLENVLFFMPILPSVKEEMILFS